MDDTFTSTNTLLAALSTFHDSISVVRYIVLYLIMLYLQQTSPLTQFFIESTTAQEREFLHTFTKENKTNITLLPVKTVGVQVWIHYELLHNLCNIFCCRVIVGHTAMWQPYLLILNLNGQIYSH